jgi:hypothetical protein
MCQLIHSTAIFSLDKLLASSHASNQKGEASLHFIMRAERQKRPQSDIAISESLDTWSSKAVILRKVSIDSPQRDLTAKRDQRINDRRRGMG